MPRCPRRSVHVPPCCDQLLRPVRRLVAMMAPPPADERPSVRVHLKRLKSLCVEILTVTDPAILTAIPGFAMHDELAELVRLANMTPREALAAAAIRPARFLRVADLFGTFAPGKVADLVLLDMSRSLVRKALRSPTMR